MGHACVTKHYLKRLVFLKIIPHDIEIINHTACRFSVLLIIRIASLEAYQLRIS